MTSILKVDTIQDTAGNNIINESSDTITIGASGDTVTTSANVGISATSPQNRLAVGVSLGETKGLVLQYANEAKAGFLVAPTTGEVRIGAINSTGTYFPSFYSNNTEAMRINTGGDVGIGATTIGAKFHARYDGNATIGQRCDDTYASAGTNKAIQFVRNAVEVGTITMTTTATAYNQSSDYRLKENVNYNFDATTRLKQLKPARFNFIRDADKTVDGFLAHEVQDIIPEAIHGIKDETETKEKVVVNSDGNVIAENIEQADWEAGKIPNEEGTSQYPIDSTWEASKVVPVYQGIDQSKLTPLLTKALQEAIAKIEQLEARIITLENN